MNPRAAATRGRQLVLALLAAAVPIACTQSGEHQTGATDPASTKSSKPADEWFVDRAAETGLDFVHFNGMSGGFYASEIFAPGVALFDYDNDGDLDVFVVQGAMLGPKPLSAALFPPKGPLPLTGRLYRNDLVIHEDGTRMLHFTDVTEASGLQTRGYGMGVAAGDFNNDGCVDLYVTNFGPNQLFRNNCDGTFTDVSKQSRTDDASWSVSASFVDYDRDGWLDLFVGNYLSYTIDTDERCSSAAGKRDYCAPSTYRPAPSRLYHNNRDGTFTDVSATALLGGEYGPALGVVVADLNGDGWPDIYVANDGRENLLWMNQRNGTFRNTAVLAGAAVTGSGKATASMGVDAGDFDNDGDEDLFHANQAGEGHTLLVSNGTGFFDDMTAESGLGPRSLPFTGFGAAWADVDNDGWLDLLVVNGAVRIVEALARKNDPFPLSQHPQLFRNMGNGRFEDVTDRAGSVFRVPMVGRGAAFGDVDNDGDTDVLVGNNNGKMQLLVNNIGNHNHWVGLRLIGSKGGRDMLGARVGVTLANGRTYWRRAHSDGSYGSANDPRVLVGLGRSVEPVRVSVAWPDGTREDWPRVAIDQYTTLTQRGGRWGR